MQRKTRSDVVQLYFVIGCLFWNEKGILFFFFFFFLTAAGGLGMDVGRRYQGNSDLCTPQAKQQEVFATGRIKDDTGNLYNVISRVRSYV